MTAAGDLADLRSTYRPIDGDRLGFVDGSGFVRPRARTIDAVPYVGPDVVIAPGGDAVLLGEQRLVRYDTRGRPRFQLDHSSDDRPILTAVTKRTTVISTCDRAGRCDARGIDATGKQTWRSRIGWVGPITIRRTVEDWPTQVVSEEGRDRWRIGDADTGRELGTIARPQPSFSFATDDLVLVGTTRTPCSLTTWRGTRRLREQPLACLTDLGGSARDGRYVYLPRFDDGVRQVVDLEDQDLVDPKIAAPSMADDGRLTSHGRTLVTVADDAIVATDRFTGRRVWRVPARGIEVLGASDGAVLARIDGASRLLRSRGDELIVIDAGDGHVRGRWTIAPDDDVRSSTLLVGAAVVTVTGEDGERSRLVGSLD